MGLKLSDRDINLAQQILKSQFSQLNGFHLTLLQSRITDSTQCRDAASVHDIRSSYIGPMFP